MELSDEVDLIGGDFALLPSLEVDPITGMFECAAVANGDEEPANVSNPLNFGVDDVNVDVNVYDDACPKGDFNSAAGAKGAGDGPGLTENADCLVCGVASLDAPNMFWPLTVANGELVDA